MMALNVILLGGHGSIRLLNQFQLKTYTSRILIPLHFNLASLFSSNLQPLF